MGGIHGETFSTLNTSSDEVTALSSVAMAEQLPLVSPMALETAAMAVRERSRLEGDRTAAAVEALALLNSVSEHSVTFQPTLSALRDTFEALIFSQLPHPGVPLEQRLTFAELTRRTTRDDELALTFLRHAKEVDREVVSLRMQLAQLQGSAGGLTAEQRAEYELAQQKSIEELMAENRRLLLKAEVETETMAARAGDLREKLEAATQQAKSAYDELEQRAAEAAKAAPAAVRRADERIPRTWESIVARLEREFSELVEGKEELKRKEEWGSPSIDSTEVARRQLAAELAHEMDLLAGCIG